VSQILAEHFKSLEKLSKATIESLTALSDIGPEVARSVVDFFQSPLNTEFISDLLDGSLGIQPVVSESPQKGTLAGKKFVLTGTLPNLTRAEAKARIAAKGARVLTAVSRETDYVVLGEAAGQKLAQAQKLGVTILNEETFLKLLAEDN
jgi:DNA ligase (NAD+)